MRGFITLPGILLKYDPVKRKYFPANHVIDQIGPVNSMDPPSTENELYFRSSILHSMLPLIYQGKRDEAWRFFHENYKLDDKKEIERRVKAILLTQPVYKFIYHHRKQTEKN